MAFYLARGGKHWPKELSYVLEMRAMGITDFWVYAAQPVVYRDDVMLVTEAEAAAKEHWRNEGGGNS